MIELSTGRDIGYDDIEQLYRSKGHTSYDKRMDALFEAVMASDYLVTAWDSGQLIGLIRSSGDLMFTQYVADFVIHPDHQSKGVASKLMDAYLEAADDVEKVYLMMQGPTSAFTRNWLIHKGFETRGSDPSSIYLKTKRK
ncbi:GNAT family N-acetyltransferase [Salinicoccus sp. RF5]|uniref:GNAT family N-acetyltransferase n=1 Tax=Salinicoccus sp. RF5 TaxID=2748874 RepID=UPI001E65B018|nr:GNAT family N-acetyltransferase [Salinicoccus sp. RF5]MCC4723245.1 GNAT family N-acetyltransferase [Salinicoccus sp. RF5]